MSASPHTQFGIEIQPRPEVVGIETFGPNEIKLEQLGDLTLLRRVVESAVAKGVEPELNAEKHMSPEEVIEELEGGISDPNNPVMFSGPNAEYLVGLVKEAASSDELDPDTQDDARYILGQQPKHGSWSYDLVELENNKRESNQEEVLRKAKNDSLGGAPEPIHVHHDQKGGLEVEINGFEEAVLTMRAAKLLASREGATSQEIDALQELNDTIVRQEESKVVLGNEAGKFALKAVRGVAAGILKQPDEELARIYRADKKLAKLMLKEVVHPNGESSQRLHLVDVEDSGSEQLSSETEHKIAA